MTNQLNGGLAKDFRQNLELQMANGLSGIEINPGKSIEELRD